MIIKQRLWGTTVCLLFIALLACRKNVGPAERVTGTTNNTKPPVKKPVSNAGMDFSIQLPQDTASLVGAYTAAVSIKSIQWKKLAGMAGDIETPDSLRTKVRGLQVGIYYFELTVIDNANQMASDTVKLTVLNKEGVTFKPDSVTFRELDWIFPWYNALEVPKIYSFVPIGAPIKVYIQRGAQPTWVEVFPLSPEPNNHVYEYFIETWLNAGMYNYGSLYVFYYGMDVSDKPHLKVTF